MQKADGRTQTWLRSTRLGTCVPDAPRLADLATTSSCLSDAHGAWPLSSNASSWLAMAEFCIDRCRACPRCRHVSLPLANDACLWHHSCAEPLLGVSDTGSHTHRTGAVSPLTPLLQPAPSPFFLTTPTPDVHVSDGTHDSMTWLNLSIAGAFSPFIRNVGDCEVGTIGSTRLRGPDIASWTSATATCLRYCDGCTRCRYLSISLEQQICVWVRQICANANDRTHPHQSSSTDLHHLL